ncbi:MAG: histidine phosphatase family protein [Alphaproteobacteria bacterium HGW-Alphaproteobacteria-12]|nr:MAG: histidine phosphatase family protein [Alphaproteobacteria bacterium HGW-Alphaproteobacteria-12]
MSEAPARTEWIWIRHAPVQGQENRYYGRLDVAPEPVAPALAAAIARRLPAVAVWLSSPLGRTRATALALKPGVDTIPVGDFTDQNYGLWQGRGFNDVFAANRTLDWAHPVEIVPPEGESFLDLATRVYAGIERLTDHYAGHTLVSVAHANVVRSAIAHALGIDLATALRIEVAPLSITRLGCRIVDGAPQWSVGCINLEVAG